MMAKPMKGPRIALSNDPVFNNKKYSNCYARYTGSVRVTIIQKQEKLEERLHQRG